MVILSVLLRLGSTLWGVVAGNINTVPSRGSMARSASVPGIACVFSNTMGPEPAVFSR